MSTPAGPHAHHDEGHDVNATPRLLGGRYEVGEVLGRGGMAEVHRGRDTRLGRTVAVKVLRSDLARDPTFQARFRREAQSAAALNHPAVVAVYDSGEDTSTNGVAAPYIVMEHVQGRTLRELLSGDRTLPWQEALRITSGVLAALAYSHRAGIVHRDIKPANVMVTPQGDVKVMDFGIARAMADSAATMTQTQAVIGTAQYLSPEQARGETVDARSDLYSTGCLLFELLTGRPPFVADSPVAVAYQHVGETPLPPTSFAPSVPPEVDAIVLHALVKDRAGRYQTADEFREDVDAALSGRRVGAAALGPVGAGTGADARTQALGTAPAAGATQAMPVLEPEPEPLLPEQDPEREQPRRFGLWVLLGLLLAALVAVLLLVVPGLMDRRPAAPQQVAVPQLAGRTLPEAEAALKLAGLVAGNSTEQPSDQVADGTVMSADPASGARVAPGSRVDLVVSSGPDTVQVPELAGRTEGQAKRALQDAGLALGNVTLVESTERAKGEVVSSDPAPGDPVSPATKVDLQVASGKVTVPNVVGLSLVDATAALTEAKLTVDGTTYRDSTQPPNTVIDQSRQGKSVDQGTRIKLVIAREPAPQTPSATPTPSTTTTTSSTTSSSTSTTTSTSPTTSPTTTTTTKTASRTPSTTPTATATTSP
jgi:eukaryotic-like serine/threonine-protein kinase